MKWARSSFVAVLCVCLLPGMADIREAGCRLRGLDPAALHAAGRSVYHVDSKAGDDANDGTTPERAWRSLERVNRTVFAPGDRILFRAASVVRINRPESGPGAVTAPSSSTTK
jgi:hypothetical protein